MTENPYSRANSNAIAAPSAAKSTRRRSAGTVRRRPSVQQGHALETLGHAIEYLVDSQMHAKRSQGEAIDNEAARLLMRMSREVFAECPVIVPVGDRARAWASVWVARIFGTEDLGMATFPADGF